MAFDYRNTTKEHYKNESVAQTYHAAFAERRDILSLRFRAVAARERAVVEAYLRTLTPECVVDLPCGTGKLAPVFARLGCNVVAADISEDMRAIAKQSFARSGCQSYDVVECDAEHASELKVNPQALVSLRLMHRVPPDVRKRMLREFSLAAPHAIVSFGIETPYHRARRRLRAAILGGDSSALCFAPLEDIAQEIADHLR